MSSQGFWHTVLFLLDLFWNTCRQFRICSSRDVILQLSHLNCHSEKKKKGPIHGHISVAPKGQGIGVAR